MLSTLLFLVLAEMEELTATDMAIARYRTRHEWMNEVFSPISLGMYSRHGIVFSKRKDD